MLNWLKKIAPSSPTASLERRLAAYPAYDLPHPGGGESLSVEQAQANLDALLAQRPARLTTIAALLREEAGIDAAPALAGADPAPLLEALHAWMNEALPALHDRHPALASTARWLASDRRGEEIVFSFLMDVALLLGELIVVGRPSFQWALDLDARNARDRMISARRPVLIAYRPDDSQVELDVEDMVVHRFIQPRGTAQLLNEWGRVIQDARAGAYDRAL